MVKNKSTNDMKKTLLLTICCILFFAASAQDKFVGGDISVLQSYEDNNVSYYDNTGNKIDDVMKYLKSESVGWNALRVRLFVNPNKTAPNKETGKVDGTTDAQVCQDINYVVRLGKRIKQEGFAFMLDFHYSDTWADPSNQWTPKAWLSLNDTQLEQKTYDYTAECLQVLNEADATPDFIQIGNEVSYGMLWGAYAPNSNTNRCYSSTIDANWTRFINLLKKASKACRDKCPEAKIIIHTERTGKPSATQSIYEKLSEVDYDIIGLSYYPFWHNGLSTLATTLNTLASSFPSKKVQIVETAYYYQNQPAVDYDFSSTWPISESGQAAFAKDLVTELKKHSNVDGLYWWFPEENGNGPDNKVLTGWVNRGLWNNTTHKAHSGLYELKAFTGSVVEYTDVTDQYIINARFDKDISGWTNTGGTAQWKQSKWDVLSNWCEFGWTGSAIADQEVVQTPTLPAGSYKLSVNCASDNGAKGVFLIAGNQSTEMIGTENIGYFSVNFDVSSEQAIKLGVKLQNTTATWINFDNFCLQKASTSSISVINTNTNDNRWYSLDGRQMTSRPTTKGIYIHGGKKVVIK